MRQLNSKQDFCDWLNEFQHDQLVEQWANQAGMVDLSADHRLTINIPFASGQLVSDLQAWLEEQVASKAVQSVDFLVGTKVKALESHVPKGTAGVKNIIAVTSAKGGVGKSTTAVNLALAIAKSGAKVGLLDADIYGPSVPIMIGQQNADIEVRDNKWMQPVEAFGIYTHSIGYLVDQGQAAVWRGPMASKALAQLLDETQWPDLDYLIIDMPPGTGDIQLTLSQRIAVTAAVIVTTPQDLALADARKGVAMFEQVKVPVLGVVENMSHHICSQCGHKEALFGQGGAEKMAGDYGLSLLAQIPLHISMREDIDNGKPTVAARPDSEHANYYIELADSVCSRMYWQGKAKPDNINVTLV